MPNLDPAYRDLDLLMAEGLIREATAGQRPYSRAAFARFVSEAEGRGGDRADQLDERTVEALQRLARAFTRTADGTTARRVFQPRSAFTEMSFANSPYRDLRPGAASGIDGTLDPLLQANQGRELADGLTWAAEGAFDLTVGPLAGGLRPRGWLDAPRGPGAGGGDVTLLNAYVRTVVGPFGLDLGRQHVALGYGREGGPLLSNNARGLDMIRLASDRPVRLPGPLQALGLWEPSVLVADMGDAQDTPGSVLTVMRLGARPSRHVELGISYLNHQGGEGSPAATWRDRLQDVLLFWSDGGANEISDKVVGVDLRVAVPALRADVYLSGLTTDDRGRFQAPAGGLWEDAIWIAGTHVYGLGPQGRVDVQLEWKHAGPIPHTHHQYSSGLTLDGRVLGDALGPNASSFLAGVLWNGPASTLGVTAAWERYSGDDWILDIIPGGGIWDLEWYRVADNPDEVRKRLTVEWVRRPRVGRLETLLRVGYEHVTRFAFGPDDRWNGHVLLRIAYRW